MSPNTTLPLAFPPPQSKGISIDSIFTIVDIFVGTVGIIISIVTIYQGYQMAKLWGLKDNRSHDGTSLYLSCQWLLKSIFGANAGTLEEYNLESIPDTASGSYNNSLALSEPSTAGTTGMNDVDGALEEHERGSVLDTASGSYNNSLALSEPSAAGTTGVNMNEAEAAAGENGDVQV